MSYPEIKMYPRAVGGAVKQLHGNMDTVGLWAVFEPGDSTRYEISMRWVPDVPKWMFGLGSDDVPVLEILHVNGRDGRRGPFYVTVADGMPMNPGELEDAGCDNPVTVRALLAFATAFCGLELPNPWARPFSEVQSAYNAAIADWAKSVQA